MIKYKYNKYDLHSLIRTMIFSNRDCLDDECKDMPIYVIREFGKGTAHEVIEILDNHPCPWHMTDGSSATTRTIFGSPKKNLDDDIFRFYNGDIQELANKISDHHCGVWIIDDFNNSEQSLDNMIKISYQWMSGDFGLWLKTRLLYIGDEPNQESMNDVQEIFGDQIIDCR
jgi:hypothetical protein